MSREPTIWQYNARLRQWETTAHGWRGIVVRWSNSAEWTAAIELELPPHTRRTAPHVFAWVSDAQAWCTTAIALSAQPDAGSDSAL
jgi:hypothetical protein